MLRRPSPFLLLSLVSLWLPGCAGPPMLERDWLATHTEHFEVWSSLDAEETLDVARDLEGFRATLEVLWGRSLPAPPAPVRVYAFLPSPERTHRDPMRDPSYLIRDLSGDWVLLRGNDGWRGDARPELAHDLARRFLVTDPSPPPPWIEAGLALLVGTATVEGNEVSVGGPREDLLHRLATEQWVSLDRVLDAQSLVGWSNRERAMFDAEAWAVCHYLLLSPTRKGSLARLGASRVGSARHPLEAAAAAAGDDLRRDVQAHVRREVFDAVALRVAVPEQPAPVRRVERPELLERLGALALATGDPDVARRYFGKAVQEDGPTSGSVFAGAALAEARLGEADASEEASRRALESDAMNAADDTELSVPRRLAEALHVRTATDPTLFPRAADAYAAWLERDPQASAAWAGLAELRLVQGDAAGARDAASSALRRVPGDPGLQLLAARAALAAGDVDDAVSLATTALTRTRQREETRAARDLLEQAAPRSAALD